MEQGDRELATEIAEEVRAGIDEWYPSTRRWADQVLLAAGRALERAAEPAAALTFYEAAHATSFAPSSITSKPKGYPRRSSRCAGSRREMLTAVVEPFLSAYPPRCKPVPAGRGGPRQTYRRIGTMYGRFPSEARGMARTLVIADQLFERLSSTAHSKGLSTVEDLLVKISGSEPNAERRQGVAHVRALRQRLHGKYGEMSDSTELVREDRAR